MRFVVIRFKKAMKINNNSKISYIDVKIMKYK